MKIEKSYLELKTRIESERKEAIKKERDAYRKGWLNGFCCGLATSAIIVIK